MGRSKSSSTKKSLFGVKGLCWTAQLYSSFPLGCSSKPCDLQCICMILGPKPHYILVGSISEHSSFLLANLVLGRSLEMVSGSKGLSSIAMLSPFQVKKQGNGPTPNSTLTWKTQLWKFNCRTSMPQRECSEDVMRSILNLFRIRSKT